MLDVKECLDLDGPGTLRLHLPACVVDITGLTGEQREAAVGDYGSWADSPHGKAGVVDVVCHVERLERPIGLPIECFVVNGQYTALKRRSGAEVAITGFEFVCRFDRSKVNPALAVLALCKDEDLTQAVVLENFLRTILAYRVLDRGGALLHSVGVLNSGQAYLFSGRSNVGKTTLAHKAAAEAVPVLSDDINLVIPEQGAYRAHKVPFTGEFGRRAENLAGVGSFPLGGLVLLEQAQALTASPVTPAQAVARLLTSSPFVNDDAEELPALMDALTRLVAETPIIRLGVARDDPFEAVMATVLRQFDHG